MENLPELRKRHEAEVAQLQQGCSHIKSSWLPFSWAPGHFTGDVLVCEHCGKILEHSQNKTNLPTGQVTTNAAD